jgi:hypothetical protein
VRWESNEFSNFSLRPHRPQFNTANVFQNQPQWNASVDNDFDLVNMSAGQTSQPQKVNNHQKNSERMAEDESECSR